MLNELYYGRNAEGKNLSALERIQFAIFYAVESSPDNWYIIKDRSPMGTGGPYHRGYALWRMNRTMNWNTAQEMSNE